MIVDDFYITRTSRGPDEANAPLIVDPDAVLSRAVTAKRFEPVARWHLEFVRIECRIHQQQLNSIPVDVIGNRFVWGAALGPISHFVVSIVSVTIRHDKLNHGGRFFPRSPGKSLHSVTPL